MKIEILSRNQQEGILKEEAKKIEIKLFERLDKMRRQILKLEEENMIIRRLIK